MLWYKHFCDARRNPKLLRVERKMPEIGYARFFRLLEIIAERCGAGKDFRPELNLNGKCTDREWLAAELAIEPDAVQETLDLFAAVDLIDSGAWADKVVAIPAMLEYRDAYTERKQRKTVPPHTPPLKEKEKEKEQNGQCTDGVRTLSVLSTDNRVSESASGKKRLVFQGDYMQITDKEREKLLEAFPWTNPDAEFRKMDAWLVANPTRRPRNSFRFAYNWCSKIAPPREASGPKPQPEGSLQERIMAERRARGLL